jgi:hypothetical protein
MFGKCHLSVQRHHISASASGVEARLLQPDDIKTLLTFWKNWFRDVDLAVHPGHSLVDWVTHTEQIMSYAIVQADEMIGYLRYEKLNPANVKMFLAKNRQATALLLSYLHKKCAEMEVAQPDIRLPLHSSARTVKECVTVPYEVENTPWDAAMIKILDPDNAAIRRYCDEVQQKKRQPGLVIYPPAIEVAE